MEKAIKSLIVISILLTGQQALAQYSPKTQALKRRWIQMIDNVKTAREEVDELETHIKDLGTIKWNLLKENVNVKAPNKDSIKQLRYTLISLKIRLHRWEEKEAQFGDELATSELAEDGVITERSKARPTPPKTKMHDL